jgi:hypothetical protein
MDADFPKLINRLGTTPKLINIRIGIMGSQQLWGQIRPALWKQSKISITAEVAIA